MTLSTRIETAVVSLETSATSAELDSGKLHQIVHGSTTTDVVTESGTIHSVAKTIANMSTLNLRGAWAAATAYAVKDMVVEGTSIYVCAIAHTSGVFATDAAAGKWAVHQGATLEDLASTATGKGAVLIGTDAADTDSTGLWSTVQGFLSQVFNLFTRNVDTIADLRAITPAVLKRRVYVRAHTSEGRGHGTFRAVTGAAPGTYVDNNGNIIVPGDGSAAWLRDDEGVINIDEFGTSPSATAAANYAAIAAALSAASSQAKAVFVPPATAAYQINNELTIPAGVAIYGDGWKSKIQQTAREKNVFIMGSFSSVSNLHLIGDNGSTGVDFTKNNGIYASGVGNFSVTDCYIEQFEGGGIQARNCHDFTIRGNWLFANPWGAFASASDITLYASAANSSRVVIANNFCLSNNSQGIYVDALGYNADTVVDGNVCITLDPATCTDAGTWTEIASGGTRRHGIIIGYNASSVNGPRCVVDGNICNNTLWTGIYKQGVSSGPVVISNNICHNNGYATSNSLSGGIYANVSGYELITGNYVSSFRNTDASGVGGITIVAAAPPTTKSIVSNNLIRGSASRGLNLGTSSALVDVIDNVFDSNAGVDISQVPTASVAGAGGHTIVGNRINRPSGSAIYGIYLDRQSSTLVTVVKGNRIKGNDNTTVDVSNAGIRLIGADPTYFHILENFIENFYYGLTSANYYSGRLFNAVFERNIIKDCNTGFGISATATTSTVPLVDNLFLNVTIKTSGTIGSTVGRICRRDSDRLIWEGTAAPALGSWAAGDRSYNTTPGPGLPAYWECTAAGTPGTWVPVAYIQTAVTVAALPAAGTAGATSRMFVTDANATTLASIVAGGGANYVPVYSDGTNWRIG